MMKKKIVNWLLLCVLLVGMLVPGMQGYATEAGNETNKTTEEKAEEGQVIEKRVLFLSSYSNSWSTVPLQIEGVQSVLEDECLLDYEYMNTRICNDRKSQQLFYNMIKYRLLKTEPYDAVILGDDEALVFAMTYQKELFDGIPLVFLGVDDLHRAKKASSTKMITGVAEEVSIGENIELAKKIFPKATNIVALLDDSASGVGLRKQFFAQQKNYPELDFSEINCSKFTDKRIKEKLSEIEKDTIFFYLSCNENSEGKKYRSEHVMKMIRDYVQVPTFCLLQQGIGNGALGGCVVSHEELGKSAGEMVLKILNGTPVSLIPRQMTTPSSYYFDQKVIEKYNISMDMIPENAIIINHKVGFFEQYKAYVITIAFAMVILIAAVLLSVVDNLHRRKLNKNLTETKDELEYMAKYDALTKLHNRRVFMEDITRKVEERDECAVILFDIDNFKRINDTLGHNMGDYVLQEAANRFRRIEGDKVHFYRFAGDEFTALIESNDKDVISYYANCVLEAFRKNFVLEDKEYTVHCSVGIAQYPKDGDTPNGLVAAADSAMYSVKKQGKNAVAHFEKNMEEEMRSSVEVESILRDALENDGFHLLYQPQVCAKTGEIKSYEALLRLSNYRLSPGEFIPVAEETGLIIQIGRVVVQKVVAYLHDLQMKGYPLRPISINYSNVQMKDIQFLRFLDEQLKKYKISPEYIELEITESIFIGRTSESMKFVHNVCDMGCRLALDDFGSGYSAINYLTDIPFNKIKLDKGIIDRFLAADTEDTVNSLIKLIHSLKMSVTAEGVEREEQFRVLDKYDCNQIQGYLFSKPILPKDLEEGYYKNYLQELDSLAQ